jgi:ribosomal protein S18 acetylase RimI-like enzyme
MNGDWIIRTISSSDDWDAALTLLRSVFVDEGFTEPHLAEQTFVRSLIEGQGEFLAAVDSDGTILGAVLLPNQQSPLRQIAEADEAEFRLLGVSGAARGRGIGRGLVQECLNRAKRLRTRTMVLSTQPSMLAAQFLYESLGFRRQPERDWVTPQGSVRWVYAVELDKAEQEAILHTSP